MLMQIPDGVTFTANEGVLKAKGPKGEVERAFPQSVQITVKGKEVDVASPKKPMTNTFMAHIANMLKGVKDGYVIKMKVIFAHFPISVEVKGPEVVVKNFGGEKVPRRCKIVGKTKVEAKGQEVTISGPDKDAVGQTVANIRKISKTRNKDGRVFQDGLYVVG
jgi:large subunit ribosomal protein L6